MTSEKWVNNGALSASRARDALQVFFESELNLDRKPFFATLEHMGQNLANPFAVPLVTHGLHPSFFRYRRNWHATRKMWSALIEEAYARPMPDATQTSASGSPYWACLRRAFPDALTDSAQWEGCVSNTMLTYGAGVGGTAASIALALTALALDSTSLTKLEQARSNCYPGSCHCSAASRTCLYVHAHMPASVCRTPHSEHNKTVQALCARDSPGAGTGDSFGMQTQKGCKRVAGAARCRSAGDSRCTLAPPANVRRPCGLAFPQRHLPRRAAHVPARPRWHRAQACS